MSVSLFIQVLIDDYITPLAQTDTPDFGPLLQGVRMAALNDRQTELIRSAQEQRREWQQRQIEYNKM